MFNNYPMTSMQDMNLDWLIEIGKRCENILDTVHVEIKDEVDKWIKANYSKLLLNANYDESNKSIILFTTIDEV